MRHTIDTHKVKANIRRMILFLNEKYIGIPIPRQFMSFGSQQSKYCYPSTGYGTLRHHEHFFFFIFSSLYSGVSSSFSCKIYILSYNIINRTSPYAVKLSFFEVRRDFKPLVLSLLLLHEGRLDVVGLLIIQYLMEKLHALYFHFILGQGNIRDSRLSFWGVF